MNDEIKEIKINKTNKSITFINNGIAFSQFGIADEILDLITNLQQELKEANDSVEWWTNRFKAVQQENERLKVNCNLGYEELKTARNYKSRCENAYEELTYMSSSDYVEDYDIKQNCWIKLSNILQNGSDDNECKRDV